MLNQEVYDRVEDNYDCFFVQILLDCDHFVPSKVSQSCYFETLNVVAIGALEGALGGGEEVGEGVAADGGTQRTRQCLEDALNLVVLVGAAS